MIRGGYVLRPRKIQHSDISNASPCVRETWEYLIREANYESYKNGKFKLERGQLFRSYDQIINDLCWYVGWRKETYTKEQMKHTMKFLRDTGRITTTKKPGGVLINIVNYDYYQDPSNYERTNEKTKEGTIDEPRKNHEGTSHNYNNNKNKKKYSYGNPSKWDGNQPIDYASFVDAFNDLYDRQLHITEKKREMIRARLRTFTGEQIQTAWENRDTDEWLNNEGKEYKGNWKAAMRNDEKIDNYLNKQDEDLGINPHANWVDA